MEKLFILSLCFFLFTQKGLAQKVENFELHDAVHNEMYTLDSHQGAKAVVLIFMTYGCPFPKLYEERVQQLYEQFSSENIQFALVNPHVGLDEEDSEAVVQAKIKEKKLTIPYLLDSKQRVTKMLEITKSPEAVVITNSPTGYAVAYRGAIDNNPQLPQHATQKHLEKAIKDILAGKNPSPTSTRPTGCNIKYRN